MQIIKFLTLLTIFACISCAGEQKKAEPNQKNFESILPHAEGSAPENLTEEERLQLGQAKGKVADLVTPEQLSQSILTNDQLQLLHFWSISDKQSLQRNVVLNDLEQSNHEPAVRIILVNTDPLKDQTEVNAFIREKNILPEVYNLPKGQVVTLLKLAKVKNFKKQGGIFVLSVYEGIEDYWSDIIDYQELKVLLGPYQF